MTLRTKILIFAACFLASGLLTAAPNDVSILDYGLYKGVEAGAHQDGSSPTGRVRGGAVELEKQTDTIVAKQGALFGYRFAMTDDLRKQPLKFVYSFPEMKNPKTGKTFTSYEKSGYEKNPNDVGGVLYHLSEPWEMVPGEWTFQVFSGDRKILEKKFTVVKSD